ncbi:hypothetical protein KJ359_003931 [Pestalotiopsis sp. 9143b]|nr:hypothetical protein KJ359_003931 [Pestalotiopsis sp. 9143b]
MNEDRDRKDENDHPVVGTIEVKAFHLRKSILIPPMTVQAYFSRYGKVWNGRPAYPGDLPQIDEYSERVVHL